MELLGLYGAFDHAVSNLGLQTGRLHLGTASVEDPLLCSMQCICWNRKQVDCVLWEFKLSTCASTEVKRRGIQLASIAQITRIAVWNLEREPKLFKMSFMLEKKIYMDMTCIKKRLALRYF